MLKVGYIGLGLMGKSMARNILKAGFSVVAPMSVSTPDSTACNRASCWAVLKR